MRNGCPIPIAVKASADTLCTSGLAQRVEQRLHHAGVDKALFNLELAQDAPVTDLVSLSAARSEEHTSELQSLMRISYAVFCLKKKKSTTKHNTTLTTQITSTTQQLH